MSTPIASQSEYAEQTFREVRSERGRFEAVAFRDCTFERCVFAGCEFRSCAFAGCTFSECDLSLAKLPHSTFSACTFERSKILGVNWTEATLPAVRLWPPLHLLDSSISHATFLGVDLKGVRIVDCVAEDVDFREADLSGVDFSGTDLSGSLFGKTNLTGADLTRARNYRIDPRENTLKGAKFSLPEAMSLLFGLDIIVTGWED